MLLCIFYLALAVTSLVFHAPIYSAKNAAELSEVLKTRPRLAKFVSRKLATNYLWPIAMFMVAALFVSGSVSDDIDVDTGDTLLEITLLALVFLFAVLLFNVWKLRKLLVTVQIRPVTPGQIQFCTRCGTPNQIDAAFCTQCGEQIHPAPTAHQA